jgi:hypothetical protein
MIGHLLFTRRKLSLWLGVLLPLTGFADGGFSDIDIRQITKAVTAATQGSISRFDEAKWAGCPNTFEDHCKREAVLLIETTMGQQTLIVSNVSDGWIVGRKQLDLLAGNRRSRDQLLLDKKCERQWNALTQPGQPMEHWNWSMRLDWQKQHCEIASSPPTKPVGMDSSDNGK